jgi:hypothetical protein
VRILKELLVHFSEVRIVKELADREEGRGGHNAPDGALFEGGESLGKKDFHHRGRREHREGRKEVEEQLDLQREERAWKGWADKVAPPRFVSLLKHGYLNTIPG